MKRTNRSSYKILFNMLKLAVIMCFVFTSGMRSNSKVGGRVLYGEDTNAYPYVVVFLYVYNDQIAHRTCTGSLITSDWLLTAGHCVEFQKGYDYRIRFGNLTTPWNESPSVRKVLKAVLHPAYRHVQDPYKRGILAMEFDIALVKVEGVIMESYGKVSSVDYKSLLGRAVRYIGGGTTFNDYENDNPEDGAVVGWDDQQRPLQIGHAVVSKCDSDFAEVFGNAMICLASKCSNRAQMPHFGDSGGPVLFRGKIIGVLTTSAYKHNSLYTPVIPYIDWIQKTIK